METKFTEVMIDIETLGTSVNSVITSIAAVEFNLETGNVGEIFKVNIDPKSCLKNGLEMDWDTIQWWMNQSSDAIESMSKNAKPLPIALVELNKFFANKETHNVWGNSARFDLGIVENAFLKVGYDSHPWSPWGERCMRTITSLNREIKDNEPFEGVKHDAVDDCLHQIKVLVKTLKTIGQ